MSSSLKLPPTTTTTTTTRSGASPSPSSFLSAVAPHASYSFVETLSPDPQQEANRPNKQSRQVFSGHYVLVEPTPIPNPQYVGHSPSLLSSIGVHDATEPVHGDAFRRFFSGDLSCVKAMDGQLMQIGWATGYALSIYGTEYLSNCPFRTGNGYGDGRAMSVLEIRHEHNTDVMQLGRFATITMAAAGAAQEDGDSGNKQREQLLHDASQSPRPRLEFQLKGGGRTPYCRSGDGRAVLRSSIREFLASESMFALGVPTARSLAVYVSGTERVMRPWYSEGSTSEDPDLMISEPVAVTTRVAPSFIRVGQLELFARRARRVAAMSAAASAGNGSDDDDDDDATLRKRRREETKTAADTTIIFSKELAELEMLVDHLIVREYPELLRPSPSTTTTSPQLPARGTLEKDALYLSLAERFAARLSHLTTEWIRVGYCQGNFNADNCAAGGWTLDYGPFGFVERFSPSYQMWVGGGEHFSFMNQPTAGAMNFKMFCVSLVQLLTHDASKKALNHTLRGYPVLVQSKMETMFAMKMGLMSFRGNLWKELEELLQPNEEDGSGTDWTIFWRLLCNLPKTYEEIQDAFYTSGEGGSHGFQGARWTAWLGAWHRYLEQEGRSLPVIQQSMRQSNPKYIPREWMLRDVYTLDEATISSVRASDTVHPVSSKVLALQKVLLDPYGEGTPEDHAKYFRRQPRELRGLGGVTHCSCSS